MQPSRENGVIDVYVDALKKIVDIYDNGGDRYRYEEMRDIAEGALRSPIPACATCAYRQMSTQPFSDTGMRCAMVDDDSGAWIVKHNEDGADLETAGDFYCKAYEEQLRFPNRTCQG